MDVGFAANTALIDGIEGRYMRSLKRILGTSLMSESRTIVGRKRDFYDIISDFLKVIKDRSESRSGRHFQRVIAGRPVFFDNDDPEKNARAKSDLERCYKMAGFREVIFLNEPEAAALSVAEDIDVGGIGVVVDIGGGTSDFSVFRKAENRIEVIASNGLRLGGTDFDRAINLEFIMPCMGYGQPIRMVMSTGIVSAPNFVFADLATWEKIPFLYNQQIRTLVRGLIRDAVEPALFERLSHVIEWQLGHQIAFLAERTKIESNEVKGNSAIDLSLFEPGLKIGVESEKLAVVFRTFTDKLISTLCETFALAEIEVEALGYVVPVGGTSIMRPIQEAVARVLPKAAVVDSPVFTAIVDGLARHGSQLTTLGE